MAETLCSLQRLPMLARATTLLLVVAWLGLQPSGVRAAGRLSVVCAGSHQTAEVNAGWPVICDYAPEPGYHATHDGGPWVDVDLLHQSAAELMALHDRTSGKTVFPCNGPPNAKTCPLLPPLDLVHAQICLSDPTVKFNDCPNNYPDNAENKKYGFDLNPKLIPLLKAGFANLRAAGLKVVLRFTYNFPSNGSCATNLIRDAPIQVILRHMRELAPIVRANSDVILALQAGFIGCWGEWHNSPEQNGLTWHHNLFLDQFTALFAGVTSLEIRRPYVALDYARHRFGDITREHLLALGLGMHDDEFGSDFSDGGTFLPQEKSDNPDAVPYDPCLLRRVTAVLARAYTMTGETSAYYHPTPPGCAAGVPDPASYVEFARDYSLTTLQMIFDEMAWKRWVGDGTYGTIVNTMGPHLSATAAELRQNDQSLVVSLAIRNTGWAALGHARPAWLRVSDSARQIVGSVKLPLDLSGIPAGKAVRVTAALSLPTAATAGPYDLFLDAPDPSRRLASLPSYALLLENIGVADPTTGHNHLAWFIPAR